MTMFKDRKRIFAEEPATAEYSPSVQESYKDKKCVPK